MPEIQTLQSTVTWERAWAEQADADAAPLLVFKKSPICPTSHMAEDEFERFVERLKGADSLKILSVDVIGQRPISLQIATDTGVAAAIRVEEQHRNQPRPVVMFDDMDRLQGKSEKAIRGALEVIRAFPGARVIH